MAGPCRAIWNGKWSGTHSREAQLSLVQSHDVSSPVDNLNVHIGARAAPPLGKDGLIQCASDTRALQTGQDGVRSEVDVLVR